MYQKHKKEKPGEKQLRCDIGLHTLFLNHLTDALTSADPETFLSIRKYLIIDCVSYEVERGSMLEDSISKFNLM